MMGIILLFESSISFSDKKKLDDDLDEIFKTHYWRDPDEFDEEFEKFKMEREYRDNCDTKDRAYQIHIEWTGRAWIARQEFCGVDVPCLFLNGKDPKKYCKYLD